MTSTELERRIREQLQAAGLLQALDEHRSQFLEFPDGFFVEIVLNDGSKLADTERIVREVRESLKNGEGDVDAIVRSIWAVENIGDPHPAVSISGGIKTAWNFPATLVSGGRRTEVEVEVTMSAIDAIKHQVKEAAEKVDEKAVMKEIVKEFLKLQLSFGGESYWDPIRTPKQELNDAALLYLRVHSPVGQH